MPPTKKAAKLLKVSVSSRIDPGLKKQLDKLAKAEKRTISQYIEIVLTRYVAGLRE